MATDDALTEHQLTHLAGLEGRVPNTSDFPDASDANFANARRGARWKTRKEPIGLRIALDVFEWLRSQGPGCQTTINRILQDRMQDGL